MDREEVIALVTDIEKELYKVRRHYLSWGLRCSEYSVRGKQQRENAKYAMDALREAREIISQQFSKYLNKGD